MATLHNIRPGDRVTILTPQGQRVSGRAVLCYAGHITCNAGGRYGRPIVATADNIVRIQPARSPSRM